jgi:protocatechuate 3,4-dioxygenase beta subunit
MTDDRRSLLRRREALGWLGGLGASAAAVAVGARGAGLLGDDADAATAACVLSPEVTEGPYWIDTSLTRRDVREGKAGVPLLLTLTVQNASACTPITNADVEIWHCDADGDYSGFDGSSRTRYLRGHQVSNADGKVNFVTIIPGWYPGRTPHIHLKVHVGGEVVHTGQIFFSEKVLSQVYKIAPYSSHGQPDTSHAADNIFAQAGANKAVVKLAKRKNGRRGFTGRITLGVAT